jgi:hypothetical protein
MRTSSDPAEAARTGFTNVAGIPGMELEECGVRQPADDPGHGGDDPGTLGCGVVKAGSPGVREIVDAVPDRGPIHPDRSVTMVSSRGFSNGLPVTPTMPL